MSKSDKDAIIIKERVTLSDHQGEYNINPAKRKNDIMELNTNDAILEQNKLLTQTVYELTKQFSKLPQLLKEMHEMPKHQHIAYCELWNREHLTEFCPSLAKEVDFEDVAILE